MSLILRKECQETLDNFGLSLYHTEISRNYTTLEIVGECGKPLVTIPGIRFTRQNPTKAEIEYATKLFIQFMDQHGKVIQNYVSKSDRLKAKAPLPVEFKNFSVKVVTTNIYNTAENYYKLSIMHPPFNYIYNISFNMKSVKLIKTEIILAHRDLCTPNNLNKYTCNILPLLKEGKKFVKQYLIRAKEIKALEVLAAEVKSCNV